MGKEEEQLAKTEKAELAKLELAKEEKAPEFKHSPEKEADKKALNLGEQRPMTTRDYIFHTINNN
jgi:uncharacterized damage-inducible protein DinB